VTGTKAALPTYNRDVLALVDLGLMVAGQKDITPTNKAHESKIDAPEGYGGASAPAAVGASGSAASGSAASGSAASGSAGAVHLFTPSILDWWQRPKPRHATNGAPESKIDGAERLQHSTEAPTTPSSTPRTPSSAY
jgi:hypothetical protein